MGHENGSQAPPAKLRSGPDSVFGVRKPLQTTRLPLYREVGSALAYEAEVERFQKDKKEIDTKDASNKVTEQVLQVYRRANIPTISEIKVKQKVHKG